MRRYGYPRDDEGTILTYQPSEKVATKEYELNSSQAEVAKPSIERRQTTVEELGHIQGETKEETQNSRSEGHAQKAAKDFQALQGSTATEEHQLDQDDCTITSDRRVQSSVDTPREDRPRPSCCTM